MAAGSFFVYDSWKAEAGKSGGNLSSVTFYGHLVSAAYTPSALDLSSTAIAHAISGVSGYATKVLGNVEWSSSVTGTYRMDCDDVVFTTSAIMTPKYFVVTRKADGKPVCGCDLNTASASGVDCTQATITMPAGGLFNISGATP